MHPIDSQSSAEILVLGAGMAGLTAARALAEAGRRVTLIEASPRVGGRIHTIRDHNEVIELGAEFIHGRPPELWALIDEAGLETWELEGPHLTFEDGRLHPEGFPSENASDADPFAILDRLETYTGPDLTFADFLTQHPIPDAARQRAIGYVEGFNAADHRIIGVASLGIQQSAEDATEGDRLFRIRDGYDRLPQFVARKFVEAGGTLRLNTSVTRIDWSARAVRVQALSDGQPVRFEAPQAILALPLGVLQHPSFSIRPVPAPVVEAHRLRMGQVRRFTLLFREKFWQPTGSTSTNPAGDFSFLFSFASMPPVWWTPFPAPSNTLTGWVGGPRSDALASLTAAELGERACETLAPIFSLSPAILRAHLLACHTHDWHHDPLTHGAYSYVPAGSVDASAAMTKPVHDTLYFAGEHTDTTGHWGTVHAALRSGLRAAAQILLS